MLFLPYQYQGLKATKDYMINSYDQTNKYSTTN